MIASSRITEQRKEDAGPHVHHSYPVRSTQSTARPKASFILRQGDALR